MMTTERPAIFAIAREQIDDAEKKGLIDKVEAIRRRSQLERRTTAEVRLPDGVKEGGR